MDAVLTHWKKLDNPNYLGSFSLDPGKDKVIEIDHVVEEQVTGTDGKKQMCLVAHLRNGELPFILNRTNAKMITKVLGTPYVEQWVGRKVQIYSTTVNAFGEKVDALRVRDFIPKEEVIKCADCGHDIKAFGKMSPAQLAQYTTNQYKRPLCAECAKKAKDGATDET